MSLNINVNVPPRLIEQAREQQVERRLAMVQRQRQDVVRREAVRNVQQERLARGLSADGKVPIGGTLEQRRRQWDGATAVLSEYKVGALKIYTYERRETIPAGEGWVWTLQPAYAAPGLIYPFGIQEEVIITQTIFDGNTEIRVMAKPIYGDAWIPLASAGSTAVQPAHGWRYEVDRFEYIMLPVVGSTYIAIKLQVNIPEGEARSEAYSLECFICTQHKARSLQVPSILARYIAQHVSSKGYFKDKYSQQASWGFGVLGALRDSKGISPEEIQVWTPAIYPYIKGETISTIENLPAVALVIKQSGSKITLGASSNISNEENANGMPLYWDPELSELMSDEELESYYTDTLLCKQQAREMLELSFNDNPFSNMSELVMPVVTRTGPIYYLTNDGQTDNTYDHDLIYYWSTTPGQRILYPFDGYSNTTSTGYRRAVGNVAMYFCWDWGQPEFCRQQLLELGFTPEDLIP